MELTKLVSKTTRYSGEHKFFSKKIQKRKKKVKTVAFRGNSGNSGRDGGGGGGLNSNHWGMGRGKMAGDLGEQVPRVPRGIPRYYQFSNQMEKKFNKALIFPT